MKHIERISISKQIAQRIVKKYRNKVLLFGVLGSTARDEDVEPSDLEMLCILDGNFKGKDVQFCYKNIYMYVWLTSIGKVNWDIEDVTQFFPFGRKNFFYPIR